MIVVNVRIIWNTLELWIESLWIRGKDGCKRNHKDKHNYGKPSKTVGVARGHQRAKTLKPYPQKTSHSNHTRTTALSNSVKLSYAPGATQDGQVMVERSDRIWFTGEGNGTQRHKSRKCLVILRANIGGAFIITSPTLAWGPWGSNNLSDSEQQMNHIIWSTVRFFEKILCIFLETFVSH